MPRGGLMTRTKPATDSSKLAESHGNLVTEKRREPRYPTNDPADVQILPRTGIHLPAKVVDISKSDMRLELEMPLGTGARIRVLILPSKLAVLGDVRYCRKSGNRFHVGLAIVDVVSPTPDQGDPRSAENS